MTLHPMPLRVKENVPFLMKRYTSMYVSLLGVSGALSLNVFEQPARLRLELGMGSLRPSVIESKKPEIRETLRHSDSNTLRR